MTNCQARVHVLRSGSGMPLVLLHAFPLDHRMWRDMVSVLPGEFAVWAVDLPGFGQSPTPVGSPDLSAVADAVAGELPAGTEQIVVAGLSMGGYVALAMAERFPRLIAGLGLLDTKSTPDPPPVRERRLHSADEVEHSQDVQSVVPMASVLLGPEAQAPHSALPALVAGWIGEQRPSAVAWAQRAMAARPDRSGVLRNVRAPLAVVVGDCDEITPLADAQHMRDCVSDARLWTIPGSGHLSAVESPDLVAQALAELVARVSAEV